MIALSSKALVAGFRLGHRSRSSCGVTGLARIVAALFGLEHNMRRKSEKTSESKTDVGVRYACRSCMVHDCHPVQEASRGIA